MGMEASYVELEVLKFRVLLRILPALRGWGGEKNFIEVDLSSLPFTYFP